MLSERLLHDEYNPWTGEHLQRYNEAIKYLQPTDRVLDIACGTGYGSHLLSTKTNGKVIGGDIDDEAVELCRKEWAETQKNLSFQQMDGTNLPFEDDYFDKVISFETIEHTTEYQKMVSELFRVLKPGGYALISTPNILVNHSGGVVTNPFHTQEFTYEEFKDILGKSFDNFTIYGQDYIRYKNKAGLKFGTAEKLEYLLLLRGVRKIPMLVQNALMKVLIGKIVYPQADDYQLNDEVSIIKKSRTLFAICKK